MTSDFDITDAADLAAPDMDALRHAADGLMSVVAERVDRELRGAWRAGYDYAHVYDEVDDTLLAQDTPGMTLSFKRAVLPAHDGDARPSPPGYVYRFTYDLTSVPDDEIRAAIRDGVTHD